MVDTPFTLYVARHGETDYNRRRLMQGQEVNAALNDKGQSQASSLADRFRALSLDALYSSPLVRAWETALKVGEAQGLAPIELEHVSEMSWGDLEGRPIASVKPYLQDLARQWQSGDFGHAVGGGETILDVQKRAVLALEEIEASRSPGDVVLLVTHGRFLRVLLATALREFGLTRMEEFKHANTGVYRLDHGPSGYSLGLYNCTDHLPVKEAQV